LNTVFNLFSFYSIATKLQGHTSLLATLFIIILSGKSMVLAMAKMINLECFWVGQSNKLYITFCFRVHRRSSCSNRKRRIRLKKNGFVFTIPDWGLRDLALPRKTSYVILNTLSVAFPLSI